MWSLSLFSCLKAPLNTGSSARAPLGWSIRRLSWATTAGQKGRRGRVWAPLGWSIRRLSWATSAVAAAGHDGRRGRGAGGGWRGQGKGLSLDAKRGRSSSTTRGPLGRCPRIGRSTIAPLVQTRSGLTGTSRLFRDKCFRGSNKSNDSKRGEKRLHFLR
jgi:hypothetical protein